MRKRGFTIVELLIVIAIVLILAVLSVVGYSQFRAKAKLSRLSTQLTDIAKAVTQYAEDNNYQYPADASRNVPPGLERYLAGGTWPTSVWPQGVFDWDSWPNAYAGNQQVYQISYHLCDLDDPVTACRDAVLFPTFTQNSSVFYCVSGPCIPHESHPTDPGYCINCPVKKVNY